MNPNTHRIPSLDGIRAISIALVIVCHFGRDVGWGDPLDLGSLGVRIFFVISGFLITGLLLKELAREGSVNLPRFYFRRTLRIFPAFYFYLACMLLIASFGWADLSLKECWTALTYTSNYWVGSLKQLVAHTWSLSTEEQFYLIWPAALAFAGRKRAPYALILLILAGAISSRVLSARFESSVPAFFNTPIGTGCMLALVREPMRRNAVYRAWIESSLGLLLPVVILLANLPGYHSGGVRDAAISWAENVAIALWIDWAVSKAGTFTGRILNSRWAISVGVVSYSLYIWQQPFLELLTGHPGLLLSGPWKVLANPVARVVMIIAFTCLSYFVVERPLLRLRGWLEPKLFVRRDAKGEERMAIRVDEPAGSDVKLQGIEV